VKQHGPAKQELLAAMTQARNVPFFGNRPQPRRLTSTRNPLAPRRAHLLSSRCRPGGPAAVRRRLSPTRPHAMPMLANTSAPPVAARRGRRCHLYQDAGRIPALHSAPASHLARRWLVRVRACTLRCLAVHLHADHEPVFFPLRIAHAGNASSVLTQ
jgi:hypothetical protein